MFNGFLFAVHPDDPSIKEKFVLLGRAYETILKRIKDGKPSVEGNRSSDDFDEDDDDDYSEDDARTTFSAAGGPTLTREMRRELQKVSKEMASGGVRDGGWFGFAQQYGDDDGVKDLPGGPDLGGKPRQALPSGLKPRRQKK
jgi:hypothetical protein